MCQHPAGSWGYSKEPNRKKSSLSWSGETNNRKGTNKVTVRCGQHRGRNEGQVGGRLGQAPWDKVVREGLSEEVTEEDLRLLEER